MKIAIACDHGGYLLKQDILIWLEENDIDYEDFGCYSTESVDYPVFAEKAARAVGEKSVAMLPQKELLPLTGYVHGGCSPVGMKKSFPTVFHRTAADLPTIMVSAGRIGRQVQCDPKDLLALLGAKTADIIVE